MGWSIDIVKDDIEGFFNNLGKKYRITHPGAETPIVMIQHEGEIPIAVKKNIVNLFPKVVYVDFVPNSVFPTGSSIMPTDIGAGVAEMEGGQEFNTTEPVVTESKTELQPGVTPEENYKEWLQT